MIIAHNYLVSYSSDKLFNSCQWKVKKKNVNHYFVLCNNNFKNNNIMVLIFTVFNSIKHNLVQGDLMEIII